MAAHLLFVTLFLGLVSGPQAVEVKVDKIVRSVALELDGRRIATLNAAPWRTEIDLGTDMVPPEAHGDRVRR
ncbi:MAG: hypothetical protein JOZ54_07020 [Acidobacteria bacterium]|nr:hypothetical protein [Acidobacteriota bacterium]